MLQAKTVVYDSQKDSKRDHPENGDGQKPLWTSQSPVKQTIHQYSTDAQERDKLERIVDKSNRVLLRVYSVFPFDLFPDELTIDENSVDVVHKDFIGIQRARSIAIFDIADVTVETGPLLANLKIVGGPHLRDPMIIEHLRKSDAIRARETIQGLVLTIKQGVDLSRLALEEVIQKVEEMARAHDRLAFV